MKKVPHNPSEREFTIYFSSKGHCNFRNVVSGDNFLHMYKNQHPVIVNSHSYFLDQKENPVYADDKNKDPIKKMINVLTRKSLNKKNGTSKSISFDFVSDYSAGYRILE